MLSATNSGSQTVSPMNRPTVGGGLGRGMHRINYHNKRNELCPIGLLQIINTHHI